MKYINTFNESDSITGIYLCKQKNSAITKNGKEYENVTLTDKTGSISCKIWNPDSMGISEFSANDYVEIHGRVSLFNGALQLAIDRARKAHEGSYNPADYLPVSEKDPEEMFAAVIKYIESIKDPFYGQLLNNIFIADKEFAEKFKTHSAAKSIHHGFVGGLLQHTLAVCDLCNFYCSRYPILKRDLLITAALLHDIGKVSELSDFPRNDYTDEGQLIGHIVIGAMALNKAADNIQGFPKEKKDQLIHCILAHHGEYEFGSPKKPAIVEAMALNFADNTDAKIEAMKEALENSSQTGSEWLGFSRTFDSNIRATR